MSDFRPLIVAFYLLVKGMFYIEGYSNLLNTSYGSNKNVTESIQRGGISEYFDFMWSPLWLHSVTFFLCAVTCIK